MKLAICAVVKNEGPYISEWLQFHMLQGVTHFFITDNGSTDDTRDILRVYEREGIVTFVNQEFSPIQFTAYNFWLEYMKTLPDLVTPEWCAFIDCDEFLFSPGGAKVSDILRNYEDASAVGVHWVLYGSKEAWFSVFGVVGRFLHRAKEVNHHIKSIVRPDRTVSIGANPHYFTLVNRDKYVNENGQDISKFKGIIEGGTADILRVNHYHTKSWSEYFARKSLKPDPGTGRFMEDIKSTFDAHDKNEIMDNSAIVARESLLMRAIRNR